MELLAAIRSASRAPEDLAEAARVSTCGGCSGSAGLLVSLALGLGRSASAVTVLFLVTASGSAGRVCRLSVAASLSTAAVLAAAFVLEPVQDEASQPAPTEPPRPS